MESAPLSNIRVIDLSTTFMGPYSTRLLAQWGADVVKVESPAGDVVRGIGDVSHLGLGPIFVNANSGKRSVCLDLTTPAGRAALDRLLSGADVIVHSMRDRALHRLGLAAADVLERFPHLVHCGFRGYGSAGRYGDLPAYDDIIQAATGVARLEGGVDADPRYSRHAMADKTVGLYGSSAILAALMGARQGRGRAIEVPMFETMVGFMMLDQQGGFLASPPTGPPGYARTSSVLRRPYPTSDGHLAVMIYTDAQWTRFFELIDRPDLIADPRFGSIRSRTDNIDVLYGLVERQLVSDTTAAWLTRLEKADLPCGPVNDIEALFSDPHLDDVGMLPLIDHPVLGPVRIPRNPVPMGGDSDAPAPLLGQQTAAVLSEVGMTVEEIERLRNSRAAIDHSWDAKEGPVAVVEAAGE